MNLPKQFVEPVTYAEGPVIEAVSASPVAAKPEIKIMYLNVLKTKI